MKMLSSLVLGSLLSLACSKQGGTTAAARDLSQFECNGRQAEYMVVGGFAAEEAGVILLCEGDDPQIIKWRLDEGRVETKNPLTGEQFDIVWDKIDSTGWRHLDEDCNNTDAANDDPTYVVDIANHAHSVSLTCQGKTLPFPYDRIVNELDLRAAGFGDQDRAVR